MAEKASLYGDINNLAYIVNAARERLIDVERHLEGYKRYRKSFEEYVYDSGPRPTNLCDEESYFLYYEAMHGFFKADKDYKKFIIEEGLLQEKTSPVDIVRC